MSMDLYFRDFCPSCRAVMMVGRELGITFNIKPIDLSKGEHLTPEFLKINPQHQIPTLVDNENGLVLSESRAIMAYLMNKTSKGSPQEQLYPSRADERALVDRFLYFEAGTLVPAQVAAFYGVFSGVAQDSNKVKEYEGKLSILNSMLEGKKYLALPNHRTIADLSMITTLTAAECFGADLSKYPNIHSWYKNLRNELPYDKELNGDAVESFKRYIQFKKEANASAAPRLITNLKWGEPIDRQGNY